MRRPGLASLPALLLVVAAGCDTTVTAVDGPVFDLSELPDLGVARDLADGSSDLVVIVPLPDQAMVPPDQAIAPPDQTIAPPDQTIAPPDQTIAPPDQTIAP